MKRFLRVFIVAASAMSFLFAAEQAETGRELPAGVKALSVPGIHNFFLLGTNLYSGSAPENDEAFSALTNLGVKTIITVDGAAPNLELAHKHGMRYVHLPHGYDGIGSNTQVALVKAARMAEGPIFIHCHHGLHRGPVAAAVICMANQGWTSAQGELWLRAAGTGTNFIGLFETVRRFIPPTADQLHRVPAELPESTTVSRLVDTMVEIDNRWDELKLIRKNGYQPSEHPETNPAHMALLLTELYREAQRLPEAVSHGESFLERLKVAEANAKTAERLLRENASKPTSSSHEKLDAAFNAMAQNCSGCHKQFRDNAGK